MVLGTPRVSQSVGQSVRKQDLSGYRPKVSWDPDVTSARLPGRDLQEGRERAR